MPKTPSGAHHYPPESYATAHYPDIPGRMREALARYVCLHIQPGHFLMALLANDFMEVMARGDSENIAALRSYATLLYNHVPVECYGSRQQVKAWLKRGAESRQDRIDNQVLATIARR